MHGSVFTSYGHFSQLPLDGCTLQCTELVHQYLVKASSTWFLEECFELIALVVFGELFFPNKERFYLLKDKEFFDHLH